MAKDLETKIKEAKNEGELLKVLDSKDGEELTDEEMELAVGGAESGIYRTVPSSCANVVK